MKAIVTVVGKDQVGIIAGVCGTLAQHGVNVLEISQTIMEGCFTMMWWIWQGARVPSSSCGPTSAPTARPVICLCVSSGRTSSTQCTSCKRGSHAEYTSHF